MHCGIRRAYSAEEDDSIGVEICCPKNTNIIIKGVVFDAV